MKLRFLLATLAAIGLVACAAEGAEEAPSEPSVPTSAPVPTNTPAPTNSPVPVDTPEPTNTLEPTDTPAPTDTPMPTDTPAPTSTPLPSNTPLPTNTPVPPTNTLVPPTFTSVPATNTPVPTAPPAAANVVIIGVNKQAEYVDIRNDGGVAQDLNGWVLVSERGDQRCALGGVIGPGETLRIWALAADADQGGYNCGFGSNIWNNSERDPAVLLNANGQEVSRF